MTDRAARCRARDPMMSGNVARYAAHCRTLGAAFRVSYPRREAERHRQCERGGEALGQSDAQELRLSVFRLSVFQLRLLF
jgi:hypothetical protein